MGTLAVAVGNPLRRDDGVAHQVLQHLDCESRSFLQLTPEVAAVIAHYDTVVFIDADARSAEVRIESVPEAETTSALTHCSGPSEVVALSKALFGFTGRALLCRIPVRDMSYGSGLSPRVEALVAHTAQQLLDPLGIGSLRTGS